MAPWITLWLLLKDDEAPLSDERVAALRVAALIAAVVVLAILLLIRKTHSARQ